MRVCVCVCARASTPKNEKNIFEISLVFLIFYSYFLLLLSQSDEDDTIIILGGKSGHVCLGDRSGRSEHVPTDLKGVLFVVFVFALFRLRGGESESLLRVSSSFQLF